MITQADVDDPWGAIRALDYARLTLAPGFLRRRFGRTEPTRRPPKQEIPVDRSSCEVP
jgi:hypothetical protein